MTTCSSLMCSSKDRWFTPFFIEMQQKLNGSRERCADDRLHKQNSPAVSSCKKMGMLCWKMPSAFCCFRHQLIKLHALWSNLSAQVLATVEIVRRYDADLLAAEWFHPALRVQLQFHCNWSLASVLCIFSSRQKLNQVLEQLSSSFDRCVADYGCGRNFGIRHSPYPWR